MRFSVVLMPWGFIAFFRLFALLFCWIVFPLVTFRCHSRFSVLLLKLSFHESERNSQKGKDLIPPASTIRWRNHVTLCEKKDFHFLISLCCRKPIFCIFDRHKDNARRGERAGTYFMHCWCQNNINECEGGKKLQSRGRQQDWSWTKSGFTRVWRSKLNDKSSGCHPLVLFNLTCGKSFIPQQVTQRSALKGRWLSSIFHPSSSNESNKRSNILSSLFEAIMRHQHICGVFPLLPFVQLQLCV